MGYIPPVTQDQTTQYVNRTERKVLDPFQVTKVKKVTLHPEEERMKKHYLHPFHPASHLEERKEIFKRKLTDEKVEEIVTKLTETGMFVNEAI